MMITHIAVAALAVLLTGCAKTAPTTRDGIVTRVGFLAEDVVQHPMVAGALIEKKQDQFYFDLGDQAGSMRQIIVVYPIGMKLPRDFSRRLELKGTVSTFAVGGEPGTKGEYSNEVLDLRSWKYEE